jgi:hypothetical protein
MSTVPAVKMAVKMAPLDVRQKTSVTGMDAMALLVEASYIREKTEIIPQFLRLLV